MKHCMWCGWEVLGVWFAKWGALWCNEDGRHRVDMHDAVFGVVRVAYGEQTMTLRYTARLVQHSVLDDEFLWIMMYHILAQREGLCF